MLNDKIDKCEYLMGEEILTSDHRRVIEQGRFTYSFFWEALKKRKTIEDQERKQTDAIKTQNKRLAALNNKNHHKYNHKEIFEKLLKERFYETKKLTNEINQIDLT